MILLTIENFYIKYLNPGYEVGQYSTLDSVLRHKLFTNAVSDLHGRLVVGLFNPLNTEPLLAAIKSSNELIKKEVEIAMQNHLNKHNVNISLQV